MEMKFGVRAHDLAEKKTPEEMSDLVKQYGFSNIQLVFSKALKDGSYGKDNIIRIKKALEENGISISMLGAYFNPVHSLPSKVQEGIHNFEENLRVSKELGNPYVGSETGSFNDSPWTYVPKNHTEEGYQHTKAVFVRLAEYAYETDTNILIEPAWGHVIFSYQVLERLIKEINSSHVHVTLDLFNLLYPGNFADRDVIFEEALKTFGEEIKVIHLKDARVKDGLMVQLAPGEGDFHYENMLYQVKQHCPKAILTFEGVKADKIISSYEFLKQIIK